MSDQMHSEIAEISHELDKLDDPRACYVLVQQRIRQYRQSGSQVPEQLLRIERQVMEDCMAASQGR